MSRLHRMAAASAAGLLLLLTVAAQPAAPRNGPSQQQPASAQELYQRNCASCHGPQGGGTGIAPSLVGVGAAALDFQMQTGRMPLRPGEPYRPVHREPRLTQQEIESITGYVTAFGGDGVPIPDVRPSNVQRGQEVYLHTCAACHSSTGKGGELSGGVTVPSLMRATPTQVGEAIRYGPGTMPQFPPELLSATDVDAVAAYVQVLQDQRRQLDRGGLSLGRLGPVTEGLVAWLVVLLVLVLIVRWLGKRAGT